MDSLRCALSHICEQQDNFTLVKNGHKGNECSMQCSRFRFTQESSHQLAPGPKRKHSLERNKSNQRTTNKPGEAKSWSRTKMSNRPSKEKKKAFDVTCRCRLVFGIDHHSFFLRCGIGCRDHTGHVQKTRETRASVCSNLPAPVQDQIAACSAAGIGPHASSRPSWMSTMFTFLQSRSLETTSVQS